jgi:uncharacterized protein
LTDRFDPARPPGPDPEPATRAEPDPAPADSTLADPEPGGPAPADPDGQPRLGVFSLEGRAVPALYLVGWIGSLMGASTILVSFFAAGTAPARWLFLAGLIVLGLGLFAAAGSQAVEGARRPSRPFRGPSPVLSFLAVIAISLIALLLVLAPMSALGLDPSGPLGTAVSLAVTTLVFVGVVRLLVVGPGALSWAEMGLARPSADSVRDLAVGAVLAVPVLLVTIVLSSILAQVLAPPESTLPPAGGLSGLVLNLLSAAVLAPIGEEIFFRGYATTAWARTIGARPAIARGALFFAFAHIVTVFSTSFSTGAASAAAQFLGMLPVAVVLGWLFLGRRSLYAAIGLHGAFNAIQVVILYVVARGA